MPKVIAICTPVTDHLINVDHVPQPNTSAKLLAHSWQFGGNTATAVVASARQGLDAGIICAVGDDDMGKAQKVDFALNGVDTRYVIARKNTETPLVIALSDRLTAGRSFISAGTHIDRIEPEELDMDYVRSGKYLLLDSNTPATRMAADAMLENGGEVMYDASGYNEAAEEMLPHTSIYIASEFYLKTRYGDRDIYECCREMMAQGPHTVIFTLGADGCKGVSRYGGKETEFSLPAFKVDVVDTTGCGDTFHGAYLVAMDRGLPPKECARWASATSAIKATAIGGRAGQPTADIVEIFLKTGEMDLSFIPERLKYYSRVHYSMEDALQSQKELHEEFAKK